MSDILEIIQAWVQLTPGAFDVIESGEGEWAIAHDFFHAWLNLSFTKRDEEKVTAFTLSLQGYSFKEIYQMADSFNYLCPDNELAIYIEIARDLPSDHMCKELARKYPIEV